MAVGAGLLCLEVTGACLEQSKDVTATGYPPHSGSPIERRLYWCEKRKQTRQRPKDATRDASKQALVSWVPPPPSLGRAWRASSCSHARHGTLCLAWSRLPPSR